MKKLICILASASLLLVATVATKATADDGRLSRKPQITRNGKAFSLSGDFSGGLRGIVRVGDYKVELTKKTVLYSTTDGMLDEGTHVVRRHVYVTGTVDANGRLVASMIVVNGKKGTRGKTGVISEDVER